MSVLQTVKGCSLFYELYDDEIMEIVKKCQVLNLSDGDYIFKEGDIGNDVFLILTGNAVVLKGHHQIATLKKGDFFGEMVLLQDNSRKADISVVNYANVLQINYDDLFSYFKSDSKIFSILMLNLARMLATRLHHAGATITDLKIENIELKKDKTVA